MSENVRKCPVSENLLSSDTAPPVGGVASDFTELSRTATLSSAPTPAPDDFDLPETQLMAIELMLTGARDCDIAPVLKISTRTLYRWRRENPRFIRLLERCRRDLVDNAADRFRALLDRALDVLEKHVKDPYATTAHRAAKTLLALGAIGRAAASPAPPPGTPGGPGSVRAFAPSPGTPGEGGVRAGLAMPTKLPLPAKTSNSHDESHSKQCEASNAPPGA